MTQFARRAIIAVDEWLSLAMVAWLRYRGDPLWKYAVVIQFVSVYLLSYIPYWIKYDPWWRDLKAGRK